MTNKHFFYHIQIIEASLGNLKADIWTNLGDILSDLPAHRGLIAELGLAFSYAQGIDAVSAEIRSRSSRPSLVAILPAWPTIPGPDQARATILVAFLHQNLVPFCLANVTPRQTRSVCNGSPTQPEHSSPQYLWPKCDDISDYHSENCAFPSAIQKAYECSVQRTHEQPIILSGRVMATRAHSEGTICGFEPDQTNLKYQT
jgi:hypothetical protein